MIVTINGKEEYLADEITVAEYLNRKELKAGTVIVEHNTDIIESSRYSSVILKEKDTMEILRFVGGG